MDAAEKPAEAPQESRKALASPSPADGLSARHEAAQERVEALRLERDAATLAGKDFDHGKLRDAEDEVEAIEAAQAEIMRRERAVSPMPSGSASGRRGVRLSRTTRIGSRPSRRRRPWRGR